MNAVARQPKTIARLAKELGLSQPTVHAHVNNMLNSELLRESAEWEKKHPSENYYEPNFPVIKAGDQAEAFLGGGTKLGLGKLTISKSLRHSPRGSVRLMVARYRAYPHPEKSPGLSLPGAVVTRTRYLDAGSLPCTPST